MRPSVQSIAFNTVKGEIGQYQPENTHVHCIRFFQREVTGVFPPCFLPPTEMGEVWDPESIPGDGFSD